MIGFAPVTMAGIFVLQSGDVIGFVIAAAKTVKPVIPEGGQVSPIEGMVQNPFA